MDIILENALKELITSFDDDSHFVPFAYYDKHLDCIRVQIEDCSSKEVRKNKLITILSANHMDKDRLVGFNIKGVRHLFERMGLDLSGVHSLVELIDGMVKLFPDAAVVQVKDAFRPILREQNLFVNMG